jgi:hypothetical protein
VPRRERSTLDPDQARVMGIEPTLAAWRLKFNH